MSLLYCRAQIWIQGEARGKQKSKGGKAKFKGKRENYLADSGCDMQTSESTD